MTNHKRSSTTQSRHNQTVKRVAAGLEANGWRVSADVGGYPQPRTINGRRPDVIAHKKGRTRVVEVETPKTVASDKDQRRAFRSWTNESPKRTFRTRVSR